MPINPDVLTAAVEAAKPSTAQLDRIAGSALGTPLINISDASTPAQQARDMIAYAATYNLTNEVAAALLYTLADRPGLQNLLLGDEMVNQTEDQRNTAVNALDIVRLENRVVRNEDKLDATVSKLDAAVAEIHALAQKLDDLLRRTPLNWNFVIVGIMFAILVGLVLWVVAMVN